MTVWSDINKQPYLIRQLHVGLQYVLIFIEDISNYIVCVQQNEIINNKSTTFWIYYLMKTYFGDTTYFW